MDENTIPPVENTIVAQPQVIEKPASGNKYFILVVMALIVGAGLIAAIFLIAFPKETTVTQTETTQTKQVTDITKTADLDAVSTEVDSADLDSFQNDLNQIDSSAAAF